MLPYSMISVGQSEDKQESCLLTFALIATHLCDLLPRKWQQVLIAK